MRRGLTNEAIRVEMKAALEAIWEMDPDEPYETIQAMQKRALVALERCGYAKPYYTKKDHSS